MCRRKDDAWRISWADLSEKVLYKLKNHLVLNKEEKQYYDSFSPEFWRKIYRVS